MEKFQRVASMNGSHVIATHLGIANSWQVVVGVVSCEDYIPPTSIPTPCQLRGPGSRETLNKLLARTVQNGSERARECTESFWIFFGFPCRPMLGQYKLGRNLT